MKRQNRRKFLTLTATLGASLAGTAMPLANRADKKYIIHHVYFWLNNPGSKEDLNKLITGLKTLEKIETVRKIYIGIPAGTEKRDVVDNSYSASELLFFDDLTGQKTYQDHPIHKKFVENCSNLWKKVIVYDTMEV